MDAYSSAGSLTRLLDDLLAKMPGGCHAIVASTGGLVVASSSYLDRALGEQLAAITSMLLSLTGQVARCFDGGVVNQAAVEMDRGYLLVRSIDDRSCLAVLASAECDLSQVGYEAALLAERHSAEIATALPPAAPPGFPSPS